MTFRRRMNRRADSGIPGYDNLGRLNMGHPATKELPEVDQYGFDSEFGEGVRKGPYLSGPPPASVGWMPEHPATKKSLVEDYEIGQELHDANIKKAMERKANKCIAIAEHRLGRTASAREIESLALRLMDLPNNTINSKFASATDFMAEDEVMGMDEMGMDEFAGHSHASFMADEEEADDELSELMAELEAGEDQAEDEGLAELMAEIEAEEAMAKKASFGRNRRASLKGRRASMYATHHMSDEDDELATLMADLEAGDEMQSATGYHGSDIGPGNRNAEFDGGIMGYDEFDGGMMMEDDFSDAMSPVDVLAEEITNLKKANAKLKHRLRQAEEAVQDATGYHGEEDSVQPAGRYKEPGEGAPTARYASKNGLKRLANVLADYLAEEDHMGSHGHMSSFMADDEEADEQSVMAEILAEIEGGYDPNVSQNDNQFGYSHNLVAEDDEADDEDVASMLASMLAEEQAKKQAAAKKAPAKAEKASAKKESEDPMGLDEEADDEEANVDPKLASLFAKFAEDDEADEEEETTASKKKASAKGKMSTKSEKKSTKGKLAEDDEADEEEETASKKSSKGEKKSNKKAFEWKFSADEEADEEEADDEEADEEEETASKKASWRFAEEEEADEEESDEEESDEEEKSSSKKASFSPRPSINSRKASVKTLGNISRTASKSDSNELSKLWESAPDVSKYFS
jgi:hypothetical protein